MYRSAWCTFELSMTVHHLPQERKRDADGSVKANGAGRCHMCLTFDRHDSLVAVLFFSED